MGVARQISEHGLRSAERLLGVDHPLGLVQRHQHGGECCGVGECSVVAEDRETASCRVVGYRSTAHAGSAAVPNISLPVKVLSRLFRRLKLEMLLAAHDAGRL